MKAFLSFLILMFSLSNVSAQDDQGRVCLACLGPGGHDGGGGGGGVVCSQTKTTLYVDNTMPTSTGNGFSWKTAFKDLQTALNYANQCPSINTVRIAKGTYVAATAVNSTAARDYNFFIRNDYDLFGGYPGGRGADSNNRDIANNPTILNGVIQQYYEAYHVLMIYGVTGSILIDGLQIKGGFADGTGSMDIEPSVSAPRNVGAAAYIRDGNNVKFSNCVFFSNVAAAAAGAIYTRNSNLTLENCIFVNNTCGTEGGAIQNIDNSYLTINNCTFYNNLNLGGGEAIYNVGGNSVTLNNSIIWGNTKSLAGGGTRIFSNCIFPDVGGTNFNIKEDPMFQRLSDLDGPDNKWFTQDDGLVPEFCSPAINHGNNNVPGLPSKDITGNSRIFNGQIDMGAYEKQYAPQMYNASNWSQNNDSCDTYVFSGITGLFAKNECRLISLLEPIPSNPLNGRIIAKAFIETTDLSYQALPLVKKHYNINDEFANANNSSYVTLFFGNSDFISYNSRPEALAKLPVNSADPNKVNIRVVKFAGVSQTGTPESYNSMPKIISTDDVSVTRDNTSNTWVVKFLNRDGLGGYFITSSKDYVFTGNGNWNVASNWQNNEIPPAILPDYYRIYVRTGSNAILNIPQSLLKNASMHVDDGATLTVTSTLNVDGSVYVDLTRPQNGNTVIRGSKTL